jgi:hypothetical protein
MATGLARWDGPLRVEAGFQGAITGAARRGRRACAPRWVPRIWSADG